MTGNNVYDLEQLAAARIAAYHAEAERDRLAREVAPEQANPDRIVILVALVALLIVWLVV